MEKASLWFRLGSIRSSHPTPVVMTTPVAFYDSLPRTKPLFLVLVLLKQASDVHFPVFLIRFFDVFSLILL